MTTKDKIWKNFILKQLALLFLLIVTMGCANQKSAKVVSQKSDASTKNTVITKSYSQQKSLPETTKIDSLKSYPNISSQSQTKSESPPPTHSLEPGMHEDLKVNDVAYNLYVPDSYSHHQPTRSLLVLPGWDYPRTSWTENTNLVEYSDRYGYILILPEMGITLYESEYYPETTIKWNVVPGGKFIKEQFIPAIQQRHGILKQDRYNTLLGLSTGGRGVALIALENPNLFAAGASLSGDFSQENTPSDRLMTSVYGNFWQFKERWLGKDNPQSRVAEWKMPLYLAHGTNDNIVPESQSRLFYNALINFHGNKIKIQYNPIQNGEHDYQFWGGQLPQVFEFFTIVEAQQKYNIN